MLASWPCDNPMTEAPEYYLLAASHCSKDRKPGDSCSPHRLLVTCFTSLRLKDVAGFYFPGEVVDIKTVQDLAIVIVSSENPSMDTDPKLRCSSQTVVDNTGGCYWYFYKCTKKNWGPEFLFRSPKKIEIPLNAPVRHQWSLTESKLVYKISSTQIATVPVFWSEKYGPKLSSIEDAKSEIVSCGCHGDYFTSLGAEISRNTCLAIKTVQRSRISTCLMRP